MQNKRIVFIYANLFYFFNFTFCPFLKSSELLLNIIRHRFANFSFHSLGIDVYRHEAELIGKDFKIRADAYFLFTLCHAP